MSLVRETESTDDSYDTREQQLATVPQNPQDGQLVVQQPQLDVGPTLQQDWAGALGRDGREYLVRADTPEPGERPWRILSLDGGGVKGMAELRILERLFETIRNKIQRNTGTRMAELPLPCEYFDLIAGTSTGGLIAIMLGRLRMSIPEAIEQFPILARQIFPGGKSGGLIKLYKGLFGTAYFDGKHMEEAVKDFLRRREGNAEVLLAEVSETSPKVFVCATRAQNLDKVLFRSYLTTDSGERNWPVQVWEAARATSAAPLFKPFKIQRLGLTVVDGALRLNNPVNEVMSEASRIDENRKIGCLVSIGTGVTDPEPLHKTNIKLHQIAKIRANISINCDNVAQEFAKSPNGKKLYNTHRYFRFDVVRQLDSVELEDWTALDGDIDAYVDKYLASHAVATEMGLCADRLIAPRRVRRSNLPRNPNRDYRESVPR